MGVDISEEHHHVRSSERTRQGSLPKHCVRYQDSIDTDYIRVETELLFVSVSLSSVLQWNILTTLLLMQVVSCMWLLLTVSSKQTGPLSKVLCSNPPIIHILARWVRSCFLLQSRFTSSHQGHSNLFLKTTSIPWKKWLGKVYTECCVAHQCFVSSIDDDVHSPVWAQVRWPDGADCWSEHLPGVGEGRSLGRRLGEGRGGDRHRVPFPGEYVWFNPTVKHI